VRHKDVYLTLHKIIVTKSKEVKTGYNLTDSSKEGCGSKRDVLSMMVMIMMIWKEFEIKWY
jgi:hypothetical protein